MEKQKERKNERKIRKKNEYKIAFKLKLFGYIHQTWWLHTVICTNLSILSYIYKYHDEGSDREYKDRHHAGTMNLKKITPLAIQIVTKHPFTECFSYPLLHLSIHELLLRYSQIYNEIYVYKYTFDLLLSMLKTLLHYKHSSCPNRFFVWQQASVHHSKSAGLLQRSIIKKM